MAKDNYTIVSTVPPTQETMDWLSENYFNLIGVDTNSKSEPETKIETKTSETDSTPEPATESEKKTEDKENVQTE